MLKRSWIVYSLLFLFFVLYFFFVHPLVPFDSDDWFNMSISRPGVPWLSRSVYNPTKVFPEVLQPIVAMCSSYFIAPFCGDVIKAVTFGNSVALSFFIVFYLYSVRLLILKSYNLGENTVNLLVVLFVLFHFIFFRVKQDNNDYLWFAPDTTCFFHYTIPNLLCAGLVLVLSRKSIPESIGYNHSGLLILSIYLAICSNLFSSVILIAYLGSVVLSNFKVHDIKHISTFFSKNRFYLICILFWCLVMIFEANGNRAKSIASDESIFIRIITTIKQLLSIRYCINLFFFFFCILVLLAAKAHHYFYHRKSLFYVGKTCKTLILGMFFSLIYLIFLSSKAGPTYISRPALTFSWVFFFLLLLLHALCYLIKECSYAKVSLPLLIFIFFTNINTRGNTFRDVHYETGIDIKQCMSISQGIVNEVLEAENDGEHVAKIHVPKFNEPGNWPLSFDQEEIIGYTLYKLNLTASFIETIFTTDSKDITIDSDLCSDEDI